MQLHQTIQANCRVVASYEEDGTLAVKLIASAPYNERGGSATVDAAVSESLKHELQGVMRRILDETSAEVGSALNRAIHVSREAAVRLGE